MSFILFGIRFVISLPFTVVLTALFLFDRTGLAVLAVSSVLLHELGHLLAMSLLRVKPKEIRLLVGTVEIVKPRRLRDRRTDLLISAAGPLIGLAAAAVLYAVYLRHPVVWNGNFAAIQLIFSVFNLLPAAGLDGGEMVSVLCCGTRLEKLPTVLSGITMIALGIAAVLLFLRFGGAGLCFAVVYLAVADILCADKRRIAQ